jgi:uncharacterized delta-60 repeat protein
MRKSLMMGLIVAAMFVLISSQGSAYAAAGSLDPTFGRAGKVLVSFSNCGLGICNSIDAGALLQPNGRLVIALDNSFSAGVLRFLTNGSLDPSFGKDGKAPIVAGIGNTNAVTLQSDGSIVVAGMIGGTTTDNFTVDRYNANGTLDTTFGDNGLVTASLGGRMGVGEAVLVQSDDKILVVATALTGHLGIPQTALLRVNSDGSLDTTFGVGGTELVGATGGGTALAELSDGEILVVNGGGAAQFTATGALESIVTGGPIEASSPAGIFQSDGNFFDPASISTGKRTSDAQVFEFNPNGSPETAFDNPMFMFVSGGTNAAETVAVQANSQVVVGGGNCQPGFSVCLDGLARLDSDGSLDPAFGTGGLVTTQFTGEDLGYQQVLLQSNGAIVAVGTSLVQKTGQSDLALARYLSD